MDPGPSSGAATAQRTFELSNNVQTIDANDEFFRYDSSSQRAYLDEAPWSKDPHWFTEVKISAVALIKMVMHARSGGQYEIMGVMNGKVVDRTFVVIDSFALPVQGTETRVNAGNEAMEYMVQYTQSSESAGKKELAVGWYHSHPGYGCWLSGIDVNTQLTNQQFSDPYLAVVGYTPPDATSGVYQSIPLDKIEDFGVHANAYYPLKVSIFKSSSDAQLLSLLWNKYWVNTLSQSPLFSSREYATSQLKDLTAKLSRVEDDLSNRKNVGKASLSQKKKAGTGKDGGDEKQTEQLDEWEETPSALGQVAINGVRISSEEHHGLIAQVLKDRLFNSDLKSTPILDPPGELLEPVFE